MIDHKREAVNHVRRPRFYHLRALGRTIAIPCDAQGRIIGSAHVVPRADYVRCLWIPAPLAGMTMAMVALGSKPYRYGLSRSFSASRFQKWVFDYRRKPRCVWGSPYFVYLKCGVLTDFGNATNRIGLRVTGPSVV